MWKKSDLWKSKKIRFLLAVELLLLIIGCVGLFPLRKEVGDLATMQVACWGGTYNGENGTCEIDASAGKQGDFLRVVAGKMTPGVYCLEFFAETTETEVNTVRVHGESEYFKTVLANEVAIMPGEELQSCRFYVTDSDENVLITVSYGGTEPLRVKGITLSKTNEGSMMFLVLTLFGAVVLNSVLMLYDYVGRNPVSRESKVVWLGLAFTVFAASYPVFTDYILSGEETLYHCMRIEAFTREPGESLFLIFPGLLRLIGFPLTVAYNVYVFGLNLATVLIAYGCFGRITKSRYLGLFGAILYTMVPFRLYLLYNCGALDECAALVFLPFLVLGIYGMLCEDGENGYDTCWLSLLIGFTGMLHASFLFGTVAVVFTLLLCLLAMKRLLRKKTAVQFLKSMVGTAFVNLWLFVSCFSTGTFGGYGNTEVTGESLRGRGVLLANMFDTMQKSGHSSDFRHMGLWETVPLNVGAAVLIGVIGWFLTDRLCREAGKKTKGQRQTVWAALGLGVAALVMSMHFFPWEIAITGNDMKSALTGKLVETTGLLPVTVACFVFVACRAAESYLYTADKVVKYGFFGIVCGGALGLGMFQLNDMVLEHSGYLRVYSGECLKSIPMWEEVCRTWGTGCRYEAGILSFILTAIIATVVLYKKRAKK